MSRKPKFSTLSEIFPGGWFEERADRWKLSAEPWLVVLVPQAAMWKLTTRCVVNGALRCQIEIFHVEWEAALRLLARGIEALSELKQP